jgi:hypothetical protein
MRKFEQFFGLRMPEWREALNCNNVIRDYYLGVGEWVCKIIFEETSQ